MKLKDETADRDLEQYTPKIGVVGLGGGGTNTVELLQKRLGDSVRFLICNTDVQSVRASTCKNKILLGPNTTRGKGAGGKPAVGKAATEESLAEILDCIRDLDMIIIVAGAGGGTGSGSTAVVGKAAKELDILTIAIITSPFSFEGTGRDAVADKCIRDLEDNVDTLVVNRNQKLLEMTKGKSSLAEAFHISDQFSADCVESFVNIIQQTGTMNVDFADITSIARDRKSRAIMGTGYAEGEGAGMRAIEDAMSSFLLECEQSWSDVDNVLLCIHGGSDLSMEDVSCIGDKVRVAVHPDSNIIMGANIVPEIKGSVRIFVFGTTRRKGGTSAMQKKPTKNNTQYENNNAKYNNENYDNNTHYNYENIDYVGNRHDLHEYKEQFNKTEEKPKKASSWWSWGQKNDDKHKIDQLPEFLQPNKK
jgi:cell division protein FtsZ